MLIRGSLFTLYFGSLWRSYKTQNSQHLISAVSEIPTTYNCSPPLFCVQRILVGCAHRLVSTSEPKEWSACCSLANCLWSSFKMGFEVIQYANTRLQRKWNYMDKNVVVDWAINSLDIIVHLSLNKNNLKIVHNPRRRRWWRAIVWV
jgi:hypothetical protein